MIRTREASTFENARELIEAEALLAFGERGIGIGRSFLLTGTRKTLEELFAGRRRFFAQLARMSRTVTSSRGQELIGQIQNAARAALAASDHAIRLRGRWPKPSATSVRIFESDVIPAQKRAQLLFDEFIEHQKEMLEAAKAEARRSAARAQLMVVLISAGADALALMLALLLVGTLARLHRRAEEAVRVRDNVLAIVSHDLKAPLGAILLSADVLEKLALRQQVQEHFHKPAKAIRETALRMNKLVSDLLDSARLESGTFPLQKKPHQLESLLENALETFDPFVKERSLKIEKKLSKSGSWIECDDDKMLQVVSNLIGNAVKFTPVGGTITLRTGLTSTGEVCFSVSDTGPGIPGDKISCIFDRFKQVVPVDRMGGTGLGLYIANGIVSAHGGRIRVTSKPGHGSTFAVILPRSVGAVKSVAA